MTKTKLCQSPGQYVTRNMGFPETGMGWSRVLMLHLSSRVLRFRMWEAPGWQKKQKVSNTSTQSNTWPFHPLGPNKQLLGPPPRFGYWGWASWTMESTSQVRSHFRSRLNTWEVGGMVLGDREPPTGNVDVIALKAWCYGNQQDKLT